ncbi:MAG: DNA alkylation repair protein [Alistipes sp.]|nr:DNA alkylation repair protein [Alistipes sp.]
MIENLRTRLLALGDPAYGRFNAKLLPGVTGIIGVRMPQLRKLAREILRDDWRKWLAGIEAADTLYYEERMLQGLVISLAPCTIAERLDYTARFVPRIDNWAVCDVFCRKLHADEREPVWQFIQPYFRSDAPYDLRFAVVMSLQNFTDAAHLEDLLRLLGRIRHADYYVRMGVAWAVAECYAKAPERIHEWLRDDCPLDDWTYDKALQKIVESRLTPEPVRQTIRQMKRRKRSTRI